MLLMRKQRAKSVMCGIALSIVFFFSFTIGLRTITRQVLVKRMGMTNAFTNFVLFDVQNLNDNDAQDKTEADIDWAELYPFSKDETQQIRDKIEIKHDMEYIERYKSSVESVKAKVKTYTTDFLLGYDTIVDYSKGYENLIKWNYVSYAEYNGIITLDDITLDDGYLSSIVERKDVSEDIDATIDFAHFCKERNSRFLFALAPHKICRYDDVSGTLDFSNQNADAFIARLQSEGIETVDFRDVIHEEKLSHRELFYRTDHHWKAETGLWASRHILKMLIESYGYAVDLTVLNDDRIKSVLYPSWFLGSQGKKERMRESFPDDFTLFYPAYKTDLHYKVLNKYIDADGDFSILYDMSQVNERDYYGKNPYAAYIYGDQPLEQIRNNGIDDNGHILIIHDSFGNCVVPFLAMGIKRVDSLDLRHFTGSVRNYIESEKPDTVIILYNAGGIGGDIDWSNNGDKFDFR